MTMSHEPAPGSADRQTNQRRRLFNLLKVVITVGGLGFVIGRFDPGAIGVALAAVAQSNGLIWLAFGLALIIASLVVRAYRWFIVIRGAGVGVCSAVSSSYTSSAISSTPCCRRVLAAMWCALPK